MANITSTYGLKKQIYKPIYKIKSTRFQHLEFRQVNHLRSANGYDIIEVT